MGSWQYLVDQQALPLNPVDSTALKTLPMTIRNEVTSRLPSDGRFPAVGANRMQRVGEIESEAKALGNARDMQTDSR